MTISRSILAASVIAASVLSACGSGKHDSPAANSSSTSTRALPGSGKPLVTIGDKNFTEQFLLGELYSQALSAQGYNVQLDRDIGPTEVTMRAIYSGRLSMYPEYIGTWNSSIAGIKRTFRTPGGAYRAGRRFARAHGLRLLSPTPFSDTGGIAVTVAFGSLHRVRAIGDLRKLAPMLTLGAPPQYQQSATGLSLLERTYGFVPRTVKPLAIGLQYQALDKGLVQAAEVNTTDGQLESGNYSLLGDPERAFGWGQVVPVVPSRVLRLEGPVFATTIEKVTKLLTQQAMRQLNAAVDVYGKDPAAVAKAFLQAHDLVPLGTS